MMQCNVHWNQEPFIALMFPFIYFIQLIMWMHDKAYYLKFRTDCKYSLP